jgi:glyoxylase-like metal-dependent hydrolase (beta-lactamase superfamily II)
MIPLFLTVKGGYDSNFTYLIGCPKTKQLAFIDCAALVHEMEPALKEAADRGYTKLNKIFLTHAHPDHIITLQHFVDKFNPEVLVHQSEKDRIKKMTGVSDLTFIDGGQTLDLGEEKLETIYTPGHQESCICFIWRDKIFTGDTLFVDSCGRTDLPGGDVQKQLQSMKFFATQLPDHLIVHAGHDYGSIPHSTIGREKKHNRFLTPFVGSTPSNEVDQQWIAQRSQKSKGL